MNTWDKHLLKMFFFTFFWISVSVFAIYVCSDFLFKAGRFSNHQDIILKFYGLRSIPYFLISMPVVAFLSQIIIGYQLHKRKEWHLVKLVCVSNMKISKALLLSGPILCLFWVLARELILPSIQLPLAETYQTIKGNKIFHQHVFSKGDQALYITSESDSYLELKATYINSENKGNQVLSTPIPLTWDQAKKRWDHKGKWSKDIEESTTTFLPSPTEIASRGEFYAFTSFLNLFGLYLNDSSNSIIKIALLERVLFPILFIIFFSLSAFDVLRCRHNNLIWLFPGLSLFIFSTTIMLFKSISLHTNLIMGLGFVAVCLALTPYLFSLYFRRRKS